MDKKVIMWIEDETELGIDIRTKMLEAKGYKVELVTDIAEALNRLKTAKFDLILLDMMMPLRRILSQEDIEYGRTAGLWLLRHMKKQQIDLPIIVVTANPDPEVERKCISEFGVQYYLKKPLPQVYLEETIKKAIG
jgi:CheY-like chemotaxis protein